MVKYKNKNIEKDVCIGDTGGPAITMHNHRAYLVGLGKYYLS